MFKCHLAETTTHFLYQKHLLLPPLPLPTPKGLLGIRVIHPLNRASGYPWFTSRPLYCSEANSLSAL